MRAAPTTDAAERSAPSVPSPRQGRRRRGRAVDGVLFLDKPVGLSSNAALQRARRLLDAEKAGHGGTLDPQAAGLLPLLLGEATKFAADLLDADKAYEAELSLGIRTSTGDAEGEVVADRRERVAGIDRAACQAALAGFVGEISQVPPMHSALKHQGRPLYEYARRGALVERAPRRVVVHAIELIAHDAGTLRIRVACSKGTYIRTLAEDVGEVLGCGAYLVGLRRVTVGRFTLVDAISLEALEAMSGADRLAVLRPVDALLERLERLDLDAPAASRFRHGQRLVLPDPGSASRAPRRVRVYGAGELLGVGTLDDIRLSPVRLVADRPADAVTPAGQTNLE